MLPKMQTPPNSPSLNSYSSRNFSNITSEVVNEFTNNHPHHDHQDYEFTFVCTTKDEHVSSLVTADEIFFNGQIKPTRPFLNTVRYREDPVTANNRQVRMDIVQSCTGIGTTYNGNNRTKRLSLGKLFTEEQFSDDMTELDGVPEGTYCVWKPRRMANEELPAGKYKKSESTGRWSSKRWKFRNLLYKNYSESYKDMLVLLTPNMPKKDAVTVGDGRGSGSDGDGRDNGNKKNNQKVRIVGGGKSSVVFAV